MRSQNRAVLATFALVSAVVAGCGDDDATSSTPALGRITVQLTDTPFPIDMIDSTVVSLDSVRVHVSDADGGDGFYTIDRTARSIDLLDLRDGVTDSIGSALVPAGAVDQIRLHVSGASVYLTDGRSFDLTVPSGSSSGIKVFPDPSIVVPADGDVEVLLDFDVSQSFSAIPSSAQQASEIMELHFHPVLRVANLPATGDVEGRVWSDAGVPGVPDDDVPLPDAVVTAYRAGVDSSGTATDAMGSYSIMGLLPGSYELVATATGFDPDTVDVDVVAGATVTAVDLVLTPTP